jgi:hypothetical protein
MQLQQLLFTTAAAILVAATGFVQETERKVTGQDVLLISINELRADHLALDGYDRDTARNGASTTSAPENSFAYCTQTKPTSVPGCFANLSISSTSLSTGFWLLDVPLGPGQTSDTAIFMYSVNAGTGIPISTCFGFLCVGTGFKRTTPACAPLTISGGTPNTCGNAFPPFSPNCSGGALGIMPGDGIAIQGWYRDQTTCFGNFSHAYYYDSTF